MSPLLLQTRMPISFGTCCATKMAGVAGSHLESSDSGQRISRVALIFNIFFLHEIVQVDPNSWAASAQIQL
jgi:hypothetical protein